MRTCVCGEVETQEIAATGHKYECYECTKCGDALYQVSRGLEFVSNEDGTCYVSGIGTCTDKDIVIPYTSPSGDKVMGIGVHAFLDCTDLTSVTIPSSVTSIEPGA
ncbi:MAG: hypothetical protein IJX13_05120, partial [Clostridia bacterium]|nr:hypothetical protein [Clostridia bacterium]